MPASQKGTMWSRLVLLGLLFLWAGLPSALNGQKGDFCHLPSASGSCDGPSVHRVFYNSQAKRCERFLYNGCGGNKNNFATQLECLRSCSNPGICQLPVDQGIGDALRRRYFYNSDSRTCEHFIYRGHRGNANNFWEKEACLQFCGSRAA